MQTRSSLAIAFFDPDDQLGSLLHLTLQGSGPFYVQGPPAYGTSEVRYNYLDAHRLPSSLVSLTLVGLDYSFFSSSFTPFAPQIRYLYIKLAEELYPLKLLRSCTNLAHLCIIANTEARPDLISILGAVPTRLRTFVTSAQAIDQM